MFPKLWDRYRPSWTSTKKSKLCDKLLLRKRRKSKSLKNKKKQKKDAPARPPPYRFVKYVLIWF